MSPIIYLKVDTSAKEDKCLYFTDGVNALSDNFTYKGAIKQVNFLYSIGIEVKTKNLGVWVAFKNIVTFEK